MYNVDRELLGIKQYGNNSNFSNYNLSIIKDSGLKSRCETFISNINNTNTDKRTVAGAILSIFAKGGGVTGIAYSNAPCNAIFSGAGTGSELVRDFKDNLEKYLKQFHRPKAEIDQCIEIAKWGCDKISQIQCGDTVNEVSRTADCKKYVDEKFTKALLPYASDKDIINNNAKDEGDQPKDDPGYDPDALGDYLGGLEDDNKKNQVGFLGNIDPMKLIGYTLFGGIIITGIMWMVNKKMRPQIPKA